MSSTSKPVYDPKNMQFRQLGPSGLRVSLFSLGGWLTLGGTVSYELTEKIMEAAYNAGINTFDTAECYSDGDSEKAIGAALRNLQERRGIKREELVLITKIYFGCGESHPNAMGLSRKHVIEAADQTLARSGLKYWDVILAHQPDPTVPMEEIVRAFNRLIESDRCFYWGTSSWSSEQITEATEIAHKLGLIAPIADQPQYSMMHRHTLEQDLLPVFDRYKYGTTIWSPLQFGILTGKYNNGVPKGSRFDTTPRFFTDLIKKLETPEGAAMIEKVKALTKLAEEKLDCKVATLAIAWTALNPNVSTCILGASSLEQLEQNLKALDVLPKLTPDIVAEIEKILDNKPDLGPAKRPLNNYRS
ncbi:unnamed protein product [Parajaminaea phylloscopi]